MSVPTPEQIDHVCEYVRRQLSKPNVEGLLMMIVLPADEVECFGFGAAYDTKAALLVAMTGVGIMYNELNRDEQEALVDCLDDRGLLHSDRVVTPSVVKK